MMRFPSVREAMGRAREAAIRFPFVILSGMAAAVLAAIAVDERDPVWLRGTLAALTGLPLFVMLGLVLERRPGRGLLLRAAGMLVPLLFFFVSARWADRLLWYRFLHMEVALHLCVAIVPYIGRPAGRGFWNYNRTLFLRFLIGGVFTGVLFVGLALALASLNPLFGIDVDELMYPRLFFFLAFLVSPWFFLAGVPADLEGLESRDDYPTGLRVFAQFILIPLVTVYLVLLTTYLGRVVLTREWPSGWIGWLVSGVAVAGTLALLLVHPLRTREDSRWVDVYGRWFYVALLPSIVMLLMAIGQRIGQYGITEPRYYLLVLALTLAGIALWYGVTASRDIRIIPAALAVVALATYAGPASAYAFTERSQRARIADVLMRNGMLVDGRAQPATGEVSVEDRRRISGALSYLLLTRGVSSVRPLLDAPDLPGDTAQLRRWQVAERAGQILAPLGIAYAAGGSTDAFTPLNLFALNDAAALDVAGWDWLVDGNVLMPFAAPLPAGDSLRFRPLGRGRLAFRILRGERELARVDLTDSLATRFAMRPDPSSGPPMPADSLTFLVAGEAADVLVRLQQVGGRRFPDADSLDHAQVRLLIRAR